MNPEVELERQVRLQDFFKTNPPIWDDLIIDVQTCLNNAQDKADYMNCQDRDWLAGYRTGLKDIVKLKDQYKNKQF